MTDSFLKDPSARLGYTVDWSDWLGADTIAVAAWTVPSGLTQYAAANTTTAATITLTGGTGGQDYDVVCQITTAAGLIDQRTVRILARER